MKDNNLRLTGIESIDTEHRTLIRIFMSLKNDAMTQDELVDHHQQLQHYIAQHFTHEEGILEKSGYPELKRHKQLHLAIKEKVEALGHVIVAHKNRQGNTVDQIIDDAKQELGKTGESTKAAPRIMMLGLLVQWLIQHINGHDQEYVKYLASREQV